MSYVKRVRELMATGMRERAAVEQVRQERLTAEREALRELSPECAELTCIDCGAPSGDHRFCDRCFEVVKL